MGPVMTAGCDCEPSYAEKSMDDALLTPRELSALSGPERFSMGNATVLDFWRWALGDLRMNNARGYLAEFLVAKAVGSTDAIRVEWGAHDVRAPDGTRIEVKSTGYLQSWAQRVPSVPRFSFTGAKASWDMETGTYIVDPLGRVDVWVFALHICSNHADYDPLVVEQWRFWAISGLAVERCGQKTGGLTAIARIGGEPVTWSELAEAVRGAAAAQMQLLASDA